MVPNSGAHTISKVSPTQPITPSPSSLTHHLLCSVSHVRHFHTCSAAIRRAQSGSLHDCTNRSVLTFYTSMPPPPQSKLKLQKCQYLRCVSVFTRNSLMSSTKMSQRNCCGGHFRSFTRIPRGLPGSKKDPKLLLVFLDRV